MEGLVLVRVLILVVLLSLPLEARAAGYTVRPGDTLTSIAERYHVSVPALARANRIENVNLVQVGRVLIIPVIARYFYYHVRWGDTLLGISARYNVSLATIESMNRLGPYLLAGQWLRLCSPCSSWTGTATQQPVAYGSAGSGYTANLYLVRPGDTLGGIAARYGVSPATLMAANRIVNPNLIVIGSRLRIPAGVAPVYSYNPWAARSLIATYAQRYNLESSLPLAVGWQESGFNQNAVSRTGAVGVMQVEPYTGRHISALLGRPLNLYNLEDNVQAGVYWLSNLVAYYGGDERLAVAAYYEGTHDLATHGFYQDTVQYVNNVMALKTYFGG
jgi:LysM repeat protein